MDQTHAGNLVGRLHGASRPSINEAAPPTAQLLHTLDAIIQEKVDARIAQLVPAALENQAAEKWCTTKQARALLGNCSEGTLSTWAAKGFIKPYKLGGRTMFKYGELIAAAVPQPKHKESNTPA